MFQPPAAAGTAAPGRGGSHSFSGSCRAHDHAPSDQVFTHIGPPEKATELWLLRATMATQT